MTWMLPWLRAILSGNSESCSAVYCNSRSENGILLSFYCFSTELYCWCQWIAAVNRNEWSPSEDSWLCSLPFMSGKKSDDSLSPVYVLFSPTPSVLLKASGKNLKAYACSERFPEDYPI